MSKGVEHDGVRWNNADLDRVQLRPYDPRWPAQFEREATAIRRELEKDFTFVLEHVGSTAIPGLEAKPIVDILLAVPDAGRWPELIAPLERLGYAYWAGNPDTDRMFFVKGMPPFGAGRTHHVHVVTPGAIRDFVRFRDHLVGHPEDAKHYAALKRKLAAQFADDRDSYTAGKAAFVRMVLARAADAPGAG